MKSLYKILVVSIFIGLMLVSANAKDLDGNWKLVSAKKDGEKVVYQSEIKTTLNFGEENRMSGNSGCNGYGTIYTLSGKKGIEFEPIISTKMACLDGDYMKQENTFFSVISKTNKYKIKGDVLIFFDKDKQNVLKFARMEKQDS